MARRQTTETQERIKRAFTEIMGEAGFDRLSISDVARRAGVNRGTVYLHYEDKHDLLDKLERDALDELAQTLFARRAARARSIDEVVPDDAIIAALGLVRSDAAFYMALMGPGGDPRFAERLKLTIGDHLIDELARTEELDVSVVDIPGPYAREIALGAIMAVITLWLRSGAKESAELIAKIIDQAKRTAPVDLLA